MRSTTRRTAGALLALAATTATALTTAPAAGADCRTYAQYTVTAREVTVRTQPAGSDSRGDLVRGKHFNFRSSDSDNVWYYGYAEDIGFGFVLASGLQHTGYYTHC